MSGPTVQDRRRAPARIRAAAPRRRNTPPVRRLGFSFAAEPVQVAQARRRVAALLGAVWGDVPAAGDATLVASEVFTNGCLHGGGRVRVQARISSQRMTLRVSTPAPWRDPQKLLGTEGESGRGLEIASALAESVLITTDTAGPGISVTVVCLAEPEATASTQRAGAR